MSNCNTIICSTLETDGEKIVLIPNREIKTLANLGNYRLIIACNINEPMGNFPIAIQVAGNNIPVLCKYGNEILANQVNKRINYPILFGNQNSTYPDGQFIIPSCNCLNKRAEESEILSA